MLLELTGSDDQRDKPNQSLALREVQGGVAAGLHLFSFGGTVRTARWCRAVRDGCFEMHEADATFEVLPQ